MRRLFAPRPDYLLGQLRSPLYMRWQAGMSRFALVALFQQIGDNGRGGLAAHGIGVSGMRERIRALDGTLAIESAPRRGAALSIRVPLPARAVASSPAAIADAAGFPAAGRAA